MRPRLATVLLVIGFTLDAAAVDLPPTRLTSNATPDEQPAIAGATLHWIGRDPDGVDLEIFRFDARQPIEAGTPAPCPLSNPCQLTENEGRESFPVAAEGGLVWRFDDGFAERDEVWIARGDVLDQVGSVRSLSPTADGAHVVWWGWDRNDQPGLFLADLGRPFEVATALCPSTNPCRITNEEPTGGDRDPAVGGSRVVWTDGASAASDSEVYLFDAALPADAGPPAACPTTNPCRLTDDERGDAGAVVSTSHVAWVSCSDEDCSSEWPDALHVFDGTQVRTLTDPYALFLSDYLEIDGSRIASSAFNGETFLLDASRPFADFDPLLEPCPSGNPCALTGASGGVAFAGTLALGSNGTDIASLYDLLLYDLAEPLSPELIAPCPAGNPCIVSEVLAGGWALSRQLAAWVVCTDVGTAPCDYSDHENYSSAGLEIFVMPEADAGVVACLVLAALRSRHRGRAAEPTRQMGI